MKREKTIKFVFPILVIFTNNLFLQSQKEQLKIFEQLKVEIFLLIVSEVYVLSFFVTYLRIMLSIVSGKMYYDKSAFEGEEEESEGDPNVASILRDQNSQYFLFVSLLENFNQSGVEHLVEYIRKTAKPTLAQVNVVQNITINDLLTHLIDIEGSVSSNLEDLIHDNAAVVFPFNNLKFNGSEQEAAVQQCRKLIDEMFDIVSLPDFRNVLKKCISIGFSNLSDFTYSCYVHYEERKTANCRQNELMDQERKQFINPHTIAAPLVKLLPSIWSKIKSEESLAATATNLEFSDQQKSRNTMLIEYLQCLDSLTCLSANIYESFCNENLED